jgi:tetratricopeptide (TPR) repeat protein
VTVAIRSIEEILEGGLASEVIELCEYALECVEDAIGRVDDSDGYMGEIKEELVELHHRACQVAQPDPEELAVRLFDWAIHSEWETLLDGADRYADVLGDAGLLRYRSLAQQVWDQVPTRRGNESRVHSSLNFRITYIMETLAKVLGSVDELVAIKSRDLTYAYHYVQIVELLADAGRTDEALAWAERGIAAFADGTDVRLRDVAARELHRVGRDDKAMSLIWAEFEDSPTSRSYELLHRHATAAGAWSEWRTRALDLMRQNEARARSARSVAATSSSRKGLVTWKPPRGYDEHPESSELVNVFLWENDTEAAWVQAKAGGCSPRLWMQLAELRQDEHPTDAIPIYQEEVERAIGAKNNRSYQEAVSTMIRLGTLMARAGQGGEFPAYAAQVRAVH